MIIYVGICFLMLVLTLIKVYGEMLDFKKRHPYAKFKKDNWAQNLCNWVKILILFSVPLINAVVFFILFFYLDEDDYEKAIWKSCESTLN